MICGLLAALTPGVKAAVTLLYFRATAGADAILVEWETATELDTAGFNLYRSENSGQKGQQIGNTFPAMEMASPAPSTATPIPTL